MWASLTRGLLWCLFRFIALLHLPAYIYRCCQRPQFCPPITSELLKIPATVLVRKIISKEISSEALLKAYIARVKEVNPILNAVVEDRFEAALQETKDVDKFVQNTELSISEIMITKPLLGVPLTVKESIAVLGMSHNAGSKVVRRDKAEKDADIVKLLRDAGAIPLLTSNTPELCLNWESVNKVTGRTKNPYDSRRTCGGSSGGEASLLGAGASVIGVGSDVGGSLRIPAHFCGIWGHKPTHGKVSLVGHYPDCKNTELWASVFTLGPMARYAVDLPVMLQVITGDLYKNNLRLDEPVDLKKIKIYYMENDEGTILTNVVDWEIVDGMRRVVKHFVNAYGINAEMVHLKQLKYSSALAFIPMLHIDRVDSVFDDKNVSFTSEFLKLFVGCSNVCVNTILYEIVRWLIPKMTSKKSLATLHDSVARFKEQFERMLGEDGVFLYPCFTTPAVFHGEMISKAFDGSYAAIFNSLGMPVTSCPVGFTSKGLPMGIQVIGKSNNDRLTLKVAQEIEKAYRGWQPPPHSKILSL